jgi:hypothetical protein
MPHSPGVGPLEPHECIITNLTRLIEVGLIMEFDEPIINILDSNE